MAAIITVRSSPAGAKSGPGQAPVSAQPGPEDCAPSSVANAAPQGLRRNRDRLARDGLQKSFLTNATEAAATATADAMISYIRGD
jgi:hypothetical protein